MIDAKKTIMLLFVASAFLVSVCSAADNSATANITPTNVPSQKYSVSKEDEAIASAQAQAAAQPMNWRAFNALGMALFNARRYDSAAVAFEQAIAVFPLSTAAETEQQANDARQRAYDAQVAASKQAQEQQKKAQAEMQSQQLLSGLFGLMPMLPGANMSTNILSHVGQTMVNAGGVSSSGVETFLPGVTPENEASQVLRTRELAALHTNLGLTRMALHEDETAIESFRQAYTIDASRVDLMFVQAKILQRSDLESALQLFARYLTTAPKTRQPATWIEIAKIYRRLGFESEKGYALAVARKTWDREVGQSKNASTERSFAKMLSTAGFYKEALDPLWTWYSSVSGDGSAQREWSIALFSAGRIEESIDSMKKSISASKPATSNDDFTSYFMGMGQLHLGNNEEARKMLCKVYPSADVRKTSGFVAAARAICGHVDEQRGWITQVEGGRSDYDNAAADWYRLGWFWFAQGNLPRAAESVSRCLEIQPDFGPALRLQEKLTVGNSDRLNAARSKAAAERNAINAIKALNAELSNMPMGTAWMSLAKEGMAYVTTLPEPLRMPQEAQMHFLRAQAIMKNAARASEIREALSELRWALRYAPLTPEIHWMLSSVYTTQKQYSQALRHIETFLASRPQSADSDTILGKYYEIQYLDEKAQRNIRALRPTAGI